VSVASVEQSLSGVRIGCVRYLNSRPLIAGLSGVRLEHPSDLARALREGELDVALVPVFEALRAPAGVYACVDGVGIGSWGPVYSVFVAHRRPPHLWSRVVADPASLTSVHLLRVLSRLRGNSVMEVVPLESSSEEERQVAQLWIGNQAIAFRGQVAADAGLGFWDLGEVWSAETGLPFVYAVWVMRRDTLAGREQEVADAFRAVARRGVAQREAIAQSDREFGFDFANRYLQEHIRFELGENQKRGIERFCVELAADGLVSSRALPWEWV
jgi:chorismate dehydratase